MAKSASFHGGFAVELTWAVTAWRTASRVAATDSLSVRNMFSLVEDQLIADCSADRGLQPYFIYAYLLRQSIICRHYVGSTSIELWRSLS